MSYLFDEDEQKYGVPRKQPQAPYPQTVEERPRTSGDYLFEQDMPEPAPGEKKIFNPGTDHIARDLLGMKPKPFQRSEILPESHFNILGDIGSGLASGVLKTGEMALRAARTLDPVGGTDVVRDATTKGIETIREWEDEYPRIFKPSAETENSAFRRAIYGGLQGYIPSITFGALGAGAALAVGGGLIGTMVGFGLGAGTMFGLGEYDQFMEEAESRGISRDKAFPYAVSSGLIEAGGELIGSMLALRILGPAGSGVGNIFKASLKELLRDGLGNFAKRVILDMPFEVATEMAQGSGETFMRNLAGMDYGSPWKAAMESIGPAMVMTMLFGAGFGAKNAYQLRRARNILMDGNADPGKRKGVADYVYENVKKVDKGIAELWRFNTDQYIKAGYDIPIDRPTSEYLAWGEYAEWSPKLADDLLSGKDIKLLPPGQGFVMVGEPYNPDEKDDYDQYSPEFTEALKKSQAAKSLSPGETFTLAGRDFSSYAPELRQRVAEEKADKKLPAGQGFQLEEVAPQEEPVPEVEATIVTGKPEAIAVKPGREQLAKPLSRPAAIVRNILRRSPDAKIGDIYRQVKAKDATVNRQDVAKMVREQRTVAIPETQEALKSKLEELGIEDFNHEYNPLQLESKLVRILQDRGLSRPEAKIQARKQLESYSKNYKAVVGPYLEERAKKQVEKKGGIKGAKEAPESTLAKAEVGVPEGGESLTVGAKTKPELKTPELSEADIDSILAQDRVRRKKEKTKPGKEPGEAGATAAMGKPVAEEEEIKPSKIAAGRKVTTPDGNGVVVGSPSKGQWEVKMSDGWAKGENLTFATQEIETGAQEIEPKKGEQFPNIKAITSKSVTKETEVKRQHEYVKIIRQAIPTATKIKPASFLHGDIYSVELPNGAKIQIRLNELPDHIIDKKKIQEWYDRDIEGERVIALWVPGKDVALTGEGIIYFSGYGSLETSLDHEIFHVVVSIVLTQSEKAKLDKEFYHKDPKKREELQAKAYEKWKKTAREHPIFHKIRNFFRRIAEVFGMEKDDSYKIFRAIANGSVWDRPLKKTNDKASKLPIVDENIHMYARMSEPDMMVDDTLDNIFGATHKSVLQKIKEGWKKFNLKTQFLDEFHPIKEHLGDRAYKLFRMLNGVNASVEAFMRHGKLKLDEDGAIIADGINDGFAVWAHRHGPDSVRVLWWAAAKRSEALERTNPEFAEREDFMTEDLRNQIYEELRDGPKGGGTWESLHAEFQEYHKSILAIAEKAGIIDAETREQWDNLIYVPFFRVFEDAESREEFLKYPNKATEIASKMKKIKGSKRKIGEPIENVIANWAYLIQESMRNQATAEAFTAAMTMNSIEQVVEGIDEGEIENISTDDRGVITYVTKNNDEFVLSFLDKGKRRYFKVHNIELYNALTALNAKHFGKLFNVFFGVPKKILTYGAVFGPAFRVANTLRDTLHTWMITPGFSFTPFIDTWKGLVSAMREDEHYVAALAAGALHGGSYLNAENPTKLSRLTKKLLGKEKNSVLLDSPGKILEFWKKLGAASENAARVQVHRGILERGGGTLEAGYQARDLLDFALKGQAETVIALFRMIPFLGARTQGNYRLYRGMTDKETRVGFAIKGAILASASLALWSLFADDDRYKELEDFDKWSYYHFWIGDQHFRFPKPFEVGAIFSSMFESAANTLSGKEDIEFLKDFFTYTFNQTFAIGTPQTIRPLIEVWANKSFFTGRPIEGQSLKLLKPGERAEPWTSETLRLIGRKLNISPKKMESLLRGYLGTLSAFGLGGTDMLAMWFGDFPERPTYRSDDYPLVGRFWRQGPARSSKYATRLYEAMTESDMLVQTVKHYMILGDMEEAKKLAESNINKYSLNKFLGRIRKKLTKVRNAMKNVERDRSLTREQKRKQTDELTQLRNKLLKDAYEIYREKLKK